MLHKSAKSQLQKIAHFYSVKFPPWDFEMDSIKLLKFAHYLEGLQINLSPIDQKMADEHVSR